MQTLAEIKNPQSVAFVKQANIANGPQQVNNGVPSGRVTLAHAHAHAGIPASQSNKLLGLSHDQRLDTGATGAAVGADRQLEAVGARQRPED